MSSDEPGTPGPAGQSRELLSSADVGRTIARMAHQIIEKTAFGSADAAPLVLVGIAERH